MKGDSGMRVDRDADRDIGRLFVVLLGLAVATLIAMGIRVATGWEGFGGVLG